jgi:hypothetical protein
MQCRTDTEHPTFWGPLGFGKASEIRCQPAYFNMQCIGDPFEQIIKKIVKQLLVEVMLYYAKLG